jgi:hypothetical protein
MTCFSNPIINYFILFQKSGNHEWGNAMYVPTFHSDKKFFPLQKVHGRSLTTLIWMES